MGAGAVRGQVPSETLHGTGQTSTQQSQQENSTMSCEACDVSFTIFKRKRQCHDCGIHHCSACLSKEAHSKDIRRCNKCKMLRSGNFTRHDLMTCKLRDLRMFLSRQSVPTNKCKEKEDLVDLVMLFCNSSQHFRDQEEHQRHIQDLHERRRITEEEFQRRREEGSESLSESSNIEAHNARNSSSSQESVPQPETEEEREENLRQRQADEMQATEERLREELQADEGVDPRPRRQHMTIDDVAEMETIEDLNVRQLKEILATNFVDFKGCCEKPELIERVKRLYESRQKTRHVNHLDGPNSPSENEECRICMDAPIDCVLLECGHMITCTNCGRRLNECPICRQYVVRVVHIFKA